MNWIKRKVKRFKDKTLSQKAFDLLFFVLIIMMLIPDGRIAFQRLILKTGIMNAEIDTSERISLSKTVFHEFVFTDENGIQHALEEYKGQIIFLNFWATWCPPCRAELPSLEKLYNKMKDNNGIRFLFLSYESKEVVNEFAKDFGTKLPFGYIQYKVPEEINPPGLPTSFVLDKQGNIAFKNTGLANWDSEDFYIQLQTLISE